MLLELQISWNKRAKSYINLDACGMRKTFIWALPSHTETRTRTHARTKTHTRTHDSMTSARCVMRRKAVGLCRYRYIAFGANIVNACSHHKTMDYKNTGYSPPGPCIRWKPRGFPRASREGGHGGKCRTMEEGSVPWSSRHRLSRAKSMGGGRQATCRVTGWLKCPLRSLRVLCRIYTRSPTCVYLHKVG